MTNDFHTSHNMNNNTGKPGKSSSSSSSPTSSPSPFVMGNNNDDDQHSQQLGEQQPLQQEWTALTILQSLVVFGLAGVAEILGGWMVWVAIRGTTTTTSDGVGGENNIGTEKKPWWYAIIGSILLVCYGFIPCLQPMDNFGRIYAAYGGFFIVMSFLFGWMLDGNKPDVGDLIGGAICLVGVFVILFWPR